MSRNRGAIWLLQRSIYPGGGKLKIKDCIFGKFQSGAWTGTVNATIPVDGTLIMVRVLSHGIRSDDTLTVENQVVAKWSGKVCGYNDSGSGYYFYLFEPTKVKAGDKLVLKRSTGSGSSIVRDGLYIGIIV